MRILLAPGTVTSCCLLDGLLGAPPEAKRLGHSACSYLQRAGTHGRSTKDRRPSGPRVQADRAIRGSGGDRAIRRGSRDRRALRGPSSNGGKNSQPDPIMSTRTPLPQQDPAALLRITFLTIEPAFQPLIYLTISSVFQMRKGFQDPSTSV